MISHCFRKCLLAQIYNNIGRTIPGAKWIKMTLNGLLPKSQSKIKMPGAISVKRLCSASLGSFPSSLKHTPVSLEIGLASLCRGLLLDNGELHTHGMFSGQSVLKEKQKPLGRLTIDTSSLTLPLLAAVGKRSKGSVLVSVSLPTERLIFQLRSVSGSYVSCQKEI